MIIKSQFKVDLFQLKNSRDQAGLVQSLKEQAARDLGVKLVELFPFIRNDGESFKGELPHLTINPQHEFNDLYRTEFIAIPMDAWQRIRILIGDPKIIKVLEE